MRRPWIVGNWKMNGLRAQLEEAGKIHASAAEYDDVDVALCPPFPLIAAMADQSGSDLPIGGQDCHASTSGAFTGSVSAPMLVDAGAKLVIVGHSERREGFGETDALVQEKATAALTAGLDVIICVGEPLTVREAGEETGYVLKQVAGSLPTDANMMKGRRVAIAYEPIWAIGTGRTASPSDVAAMHAAIRGVLVEQLGGEQGAAVRILYGGSVNADNAAELLAVADVDGALVGGASLTAEKFVPVIAAASTKHRV